MKTLLLVVAIAALTLAEAVPSLTSEDIPVAVSSGAKTDSKLSDTTASNRGKLSIKRKSRSILGTILEKPKQDYHQVGQMLEDIIGVVDNTVGKVTDAVEEVVGDSINTAIGVVQVVGEGVENFNDAVEKKVEDGKVERNTTAENDKDDTQDKIVYGSNEDTAESKGILGNLVGNLIGGNRGKLSIKRKSRSILGTILEKPKQDYHQVGQMLEDIIGVVDNTAGKVTDAVEEVVGDSINTAIGVVQVVGEGVENFNDAVEKKVEDGKVERNTTAENDKDDTQDKIVYGSNEDTAESKGILGNLVGNLIGGNRGKLSIKRKSRSILGTILEKPKQDYHQVGQMLEDIIGVVDNTVGKVTDAVEEVVGDSINTAIGVVQVVGEGVENFNDAVEKKVEDGKVERNTTAENDKDDTQDKIVYGSNEDTAESKGILGNLVGNLIGGNRGKLSIKRKSRSILGTILEKPKQDYHQVGQMLEDIIGVVDNTVGKVTDAVEEVVGDSINTAIGVVQVVGEGVENFNDAVEKKVEDGKVERNTTAENDKDDTQDEIVYGSNEDTAESKGILGNLVGNLIGVNRGKLSIKRKSRSILGTILEKPKQDYHQVGQMLEDIIGVVDNTVGKVTDAVEEVVGDSINTAIGVVQVVGEGVENFNDAVEKKVEDGKVERNTTAENDKDDTQDQIVYGSNEDTAESKGILGNLVGNLIGGNRGKLSIKRKSRSILGTILEKPKQDYHQVGQMLEDIIGVVDNTVGKVTDAVEEVVGDSINTAIGVVQVVGEGVENFNDAVEKKVEDGKVERNTTAENDKDDTQDEIVYGSNEDTAESKGILGNLVGNLIGGNRGKLSIKRKSRSILGTILEKPKQDYHQVGQMLEDIIGVVDNTVGKVTDAVEEVVGDSISTAIGVVQVVGEGVENFKDAVEKKVEDGKVERNTTAENDKDDTQDEIVYGSNEDTAESKGILGNLVGNLIGGNRGKLSIKRKSRSILGTIFGKPKQDYHQVGQMLEDIIVVVDNTVGKVTDAVEEVVGDSINTAIGVVQVVGEGVENFNDAVEKKVEDGKVERNTTAENDKDDTQDEIVYESNDDTAESKDVPKSVAADLDLKMLMMEDGTPQRKCYCSCNLNNQPVFMEIDSLNLPQTYAVV